MPRILRIINRFNLGGPSYNAALLSKHIHPDFETLLIGGSHEEDETSSMHIMNELSLKPQVISTMGRELSLSNDRKAFKAIKAIISDFKPDIIHTRASKAGALGRLAALGKPSIKLVHTFHGHVFHSYFGKSKTLFYKKIERYLASKSEKIIAISEEQKREISEDHAICKKEKIAVVPLGFDLAKFRINNEGKRDSFRKKYALEDDEIAIGIIGRLSAIKNHKLFIHAFKKAKDSCQKKLKAFIIGDGALKLELIELCQQLNLKYSNENEPPKNDVDLIFTSWLLKMEDVYPGLDITVLSSLNEGTPVSLIESQAAGIPVISTDVGGVKNCMQDQITGLIVPSNDEFLLSSAIIELANNPEKRVQFANSCWPFVKDRYHYTRLVDDMEKIYREILA